MATMVEMIQTSNSTAMVRVANNEKGIKATAEKHRKRKKKERNCPEKTE